MFFYKIFMLNFSNNKNFYDLISHGLIANLSTYFLDFVDFSMNLFGNTVIFI